LGILASELGTILELAKSGDIFGVEPFNETPIELRRINDVAFSGNGEPTAFAQFGKACEITAELLAKHELNNTKIVVITNATLLDRPGVAKAMEFLDQHRGEIWAKLDAGTEEYYRRVERTSVPMERVLKNIAETGRVRPIVIQSMFMKVEGEAPAAEEIEAYLGRLRELMDKGCQIKLVQVYTVARKTAETVISALPDATLDAIAERVRAVGLKVETYYGVG
jgi:wyosine [tRNA(Phe)-imidazoG37] synthetase (radical SAM superfamily)